MALCQEVDYAFTVSKMRPNTIGDPQEYILDLLLIIIYMLHIREASTNVKFISYADNWEVFSVRSGIMMITIRISRISMNREMHGIQSMVHAHDIHVWTILKLRNCNVHSPRNFKMKNRCKTKY